MLVKKLTQKEVSQMSRNELGSLYDKYLDDLCNLDYVTDELLCDQINHNLNLIESKLFFNEF